MNNFILLFLPVTASLHSFSVIDLLAILQETGSSVFSTFLYLTFDRVALELLSVLCKFGNSTKCSKIPFDSDSFQNS